MADQQSAPGPGMDVEEIGELLRERVARRLRDGSYTEGDLQRIREIGLTLEARRRSAGRWVVQMDRLNRGWDTSRMPEITSHRPGVGKFIVAGKKAVWKILGPVARVFINPQKEFNSNVVRVLNVLGGTMERATEELEAHADSLSRIPELTRRVDFLAGLVRAAAPQAPSPEPAGDTAGHPDDPIYVAFEEAFRGSREEIARRQASYLPIFEGRGPVLDIGCGRGEFLTLLKGNGIEARGVDLNAAMVEDARKAGLEVTAADGIAYLRALPAGSLGGIFAAQVVEHLGPDLLLTLVREGCRVLREGGVMVLESLDPRSMAIYTGQFYLDPSHRNPVHPETLSFLCRAVGFASTEIRGLAPFPEEAKLRLLSHYDHLEPEVRRLMDTVNHDLAQLNNMIYAEQEYALIARR